MTKKRRADHPEPARQNVPIDWSTLQKRFEELDSDASFQPFRRMIDQLGVLVRAKSETQDTAQLLLAVIERLHEVHVAGGSPSQVAEEITSGKFISNPAWKANQLVQANTVGVVNIVQGARGQIGRIDPGVPVPVV